MLMWAALLMISGIYLKAMEPLAVNASGGPLLERQWHDQPGDRRRHAAGALGGGRDLLQPLAIFKGGVAGRRKWRRTWPSSA